MEADLGAVQLQVVQGLQSDIAQVNIELQLLYSTTDDLRNEISAMQDEIIQYSHRSSQLEKRAAQSSWYNSKLGPTPPPSATKGRSNGRRYSANASYARTPLTPQATRDSPGPSVTFPRDGNQTGPHSRHTSLNNTSMGTVVDSYAAKVRQLRRLQQKNEETARQLITKNSQFATTSRSLSQNIKAQRDNQDLEHIRVELHTVQDDVESLKYKLYVLKKRNALGVEEKAAEVPKKPLMGPSAQSLLETKLKELAEWKLIYHKESAELKELREQCALLERHGA